MLIDRSILIDAGPDLYHHVLTYRFRPADLAGILITHSHEDHLAAAELRLTREPFSLRDRTRPLPVWGNPNVLETIRTTLETQDDEEIRGQFGLELHPARAFESFHIGDYTITPLQGEHVPTEPCLLYAIESRGRTFLQANDTGYFPETTWQWLADKRLDGISLECTNGAIEGWHGHLGVKELIEVVERLRKTGSLAPSAAVTATHFSHNGEWLHHELEAALGPHGVLVAYDGMCLNV